MRLAVYHLTEYLYGSPAWDSFNELRLRPADDYRQTMLSFEVAIEPRPPLRSQLDAFGNATHHFYLPHEHDRLRIEARSVVATYPVPTPRAVPASVLPDLRHRFFEYLAPTERVPLDRDWFEVFGALYLTPDAELAGYLVDLTRYLHGRFAYRADATDVDTPLAEFAEHTSGVCQDYAHAMLALCRAAGIPARYVSGYVHAYPHGEDHEHLLGSEGSHAWVEAFLPGNGWVGFDPTNGCAVDEAHVKVAVGRDYDDVAPVRGLRRGGGTSDLHVEVRVRGAHATEPGELAPVD
jgi:transglutaminase-like putative cysteine protease